MLYCTKIQIFNPNFQFCAMQLVLLFVLFINEYRLNYKLWSNTTKNTEYDKI
jgi:hypothetical protein